MPRLIDVTHEQIEMLTDKQLTMLLRMLLHLEAAAYNIPLSAVNVSLKINVPDGGEDGRIEWEGGPDSTDFIPQRLVLFQCKATDMNPSDCKKEVCKRNSNELKPRVEEVLDRGGSYILFYNKDCNTELQVSRINAIRTALKDAGKDYYNSADIKIYDANKIASWTNKYIPAIIAVHDWTGRALPIGFQTWRMWEGYQDNRFKYVQDETLKGHIKQLRNCLREPRQVARIVGLSGLGKTRLAFETFRPPDSPQDDLLQQSLSDQVIYVDAAAHGEGLVSAIKQLRVQKLKGIIIVDNCDLELHKLLQKEVIHSESQLSLLTLDYNPEEKCTDIPQIILKQVSDEIIKELVKQAYPALSEADVGRIVEFAQGFPQMAVLLAEARLNDETNIGSLNDSLLVKKLIWGNKPENQDAYKVISACSIFKQLGYDEDVTCQRQFVAKKICKMEDEAFYGYAQDFIKRGILDRRHRFIRVVPRPLAITLAAEWWSKCPPERAKEIIMAEMPGGMAEALCDQMAMLHFSPEAQKVAGELCGEQAPFGQAEVLNSKKGSRLFRSLVEVNPHATVKALEKVFGDWSREQLLQVGPGRRNLIWALEKLCFWEETFPTAAKLMLSFASAENETWGNNATNQFLQLFHIYLSGTQAPPILRLQIIDYALSADDIETKKLGVKALGHALKTDFFSRTGGVECQGSRAAMEDWVPRSKKEIIDYWKECLDRLTPIACANDEISTIAREQFVDSIRGLLQNGRIDEIDTCLKTIVEARGNFWPEAYKSIQDAIKFEKSRIPEEKQKKLYEWLELLRPQSVSEKLRLIVSIPSWSHVKDEAGKLIDLAEKEAIDFAKECANSLTDLFENLDIVFRGEQRKGFVFGYTIAEHLENHQKFIEESLSVLAKLDSQEANPIVLSGFLAALKSKKPELVKEVLEKVANDDVLYVHAVNLTRTIKPDMEDLSRLVKLVKQGKMNCEYLRSLSYGRVLSHISTEDFISFVESIVSIEPQAAFIAMELLFMYCYEDEFKFNKCKELLRKILLMPGLLTIKKQYPMDMYYWEKVAKKLLVTGKSDEGLAKHIANEIVKACSDDRISYDSNNHVKAIISILFKAYSNIAWPIIGEALLTGEWLLKLNMEYLLSPRHELEEHSSGIISLLPEQYLIDWCKNNKEKGPNVLARIATILIKDQERWVFHPIAKFLLDTYGEREDVLTDIYMNMRPSSWSGSIIPYYKRQIEALKTVLDHSMPNVRDWARKAIEYLENEIQRENKIEEEEDFGVYY